MYDEEINNQQAGLGGVFGAPTEADKQFMKDMERVAGEQLRERSLQLALASLGAGKDCTVQTQTAINSARMFYDYIKGGSQV